MDNTSVTLAFEQINWLVVFAIFLIIMFITTGKDLKTLLYAVAAVLVAALFAGLGWFD